MSEETKCPGCGENPNGSGLLCAGNRWACGSTSTELDGFSMSIACAKRQLVKVTAELANESERSDAWQRDAENLSGDLEAANATIAGQAKHIADLGKKVEELQGVMVEIVNNAADDLMATKGVTGSGTPACRLWWTLNSIREVARKAAEKETT